MKILVLAFDALHNGLLPPYGGTWRESDFLNRLAAESLVLDSFFADRLQLSEIYRALWDDSKTRQDSPSGLNLTLPQAALQAGFQTALFSDDLDILEHPSIDGFQIIESTNVPESAGDREVQAFSNGGSEQAEAARLADTLDRREAMANDLESTQLFQEFVALSDLIESLRSNSQKAGDAAEKSDGFPKQASVGSEKNRENGKPFFLWAHLSSLGNTWDAPEEYRSQYVEEGDLPALKSAIPPCQPLIPDSDGNFDPDEKLQLAQTYGGQLAVWETCLDALLGFLEESGLKEDTAVFILSTRGIGLGEHGQVGLSDPTFHTEFSRLSGFIRVPLPGWGLRRTHALVSYSDIQDALRTILSQNLQTEEIEELSEENAETPKEPTERTVDRPVLPNWMTNTNEPVRDRIVGRDGAQAVFQTRAWRYLYSLSKPEQGQLYAMPDDRWEINDIAEICPEIIQKAIQQQNSPLLDEDLISIWR